MRSAGTRHAGPPRESEPADHAIDIHPEFDRERPERAVELSFQRHGLEYAGQGIANAIDQRHAAPEIGPRLFRPVIVLRGKRAEQRSQPQHQQGQAQPQRGEEPERPRPDEVVDVATVEQARRDEKTARHEQPVERNRAKCAPDMRQQEILLGRAQPQNRRAVDQHDGQRRHQP